MKYIVAVSGGVDSVVLLDMLVKRKLPYQGTFVVAHFDHGIRPDSAEDAAFVRELAALYGLAFETTREELGAGASEETARDRRYTFLHAVAKRHDARVLTAHHVNDVVETVAINLHRGTGWRGLAVLDSPNIDRPLLALQKEALVEYAHANGLTWREDSTNQGDTYLRNRLRKQLHHAAAEEVSLLGAYRKRQVALKRQIDTEALQLIGEAPYSRYLFTVVPEREAVELLRMLCVREVGISPTIPQRRRALIAIKTQRAGSRYEVARGIVIVFSRSTFVVGE